MASSNLAPRLPKLEWALRSAAGRLKGVTWVDSRLDPSLLAPRMRAPDEDAVFRNTQYLRFLPTYIQDQAQEAEHAGRATAWEGLALMFAHPHWLVTGREYLWACYSPFPRVLVKMVESFGVEAGLHKLDGARLQRLAALLPSWHPARGRLSKAREVLATCEEEAALEHAWGQDEVAPDHVLRDEVLMCRAGTWWRQRRGTAGAPEYRISGGFLRFQPGSGDPFLMRTEDVMMVLDPDTKPNLSAFRLLPAWTCLRFTTRHPEPPKPAARDPKPATPEAKSAKPTRTKTKAKSAKTRAKSAKTKAESDSSKAEAKATPPDTGKGKPSETKKKPAATKGKATTEEKKK